MTNLATHLLDTTERHGERIALKLDEPRSHTRRSMPRAHV